MIIVRFFYHLIHQWMKIFKDGHKLVRLPYNFLSYIYSFAEKDRQSLEIIADPKSLPK